MREERERIRAQEGGGMDPPKDHLMYKTREREGRRRDDAKWESDWGDISKQAREGLFMYGL